MLKILFIINLNNKNNVSKITITICIYMTSKEMLTWEQELGKAVLVLVQHDDTGSYGGREWKTTTGINING